MKKEAAKAVKKAMEPAEKGMQPTPAATSSPPEEGAAKGAPDEAAEAITVAPGASPEEAGGGRGVAGKSDEAAEAPDQDEESHYPLREAPEDPRWAVRTVWAWIGIAVTSILFIIALLVLGAAHD